MNYLEAKGDQSLPPNLVKKVTWAWMEFGGMKEHEFVEVRIVEPHFLLLKCRQAQLLLWDTEHKVQGILGRDIDKLQTTTSSWHVRDSSRYQGHIGTHI